MAVKNKSENALANDLLATNFNHGGTITQLSDPIADTPMVVTLDELRPYELNPRVIKNPLYDDIKASIRQRGLDAPPAITKRPGAKHYIIRNGGNTRLCILNELWKETRDEQFFKIHCMFRPWQNEIVTLTGHLAENELHGSLTFVEKALAVAKARELYEQRERREVSQREIAKWLSEDGFPINQSDVSRMGDAINYLLPFIPTVLYGGIGPRAVAQLLSLRKSARSTWDRYAEKLHPDPESLGEDEELTFGIHGTFADVFGETLHRFDDIPEKFSFNSFQDELIGQLSEIFECTYEEIAQNIQEKGNLHKVLAMPPGELPAIDETALFAKPDKQVLIPDEAQIIQMQLPKSPREPVQKMQSPVHQVIYSEARKHGEEDGQREGQQDGTGDFANTENFSSLSSSLSSFSTAPSSRLDAMQAMVASIAGQDASDHGVAPEYSMAVPGADGLFPVANIWEISLSLDDPEKLMIHMGQLVVEIAQELGVGHLVETCDVGLGYFIADGAVGDKTAQMVLSLFRALSSEMMPPEQNSFWYCMDSLLLGANQSLNGVKCLSDTLLIKLFRIIRLGRRFYELNGLA